MRWFLALMLICLAIACPAYAIDSSGYSSDKLSEVGEVAGILYGVLLGVACETFTDDCVPYVDIMTRAGSILGKEAGRVTGSVIDVISEGDKKEDKR